MKQFLYSVAETFYHRAGDNIRNYAFVFPNRRAGIFFGKYLGDIARKPIFSPQIFTISDFFTSLSPYDPVDRVEMLFLIYKYYRHFSKSGESFDDFVYWGDVLTNDFNDVDKYMVDASALFANINELKEIDSRFGSPLSEEQISFIRRFCDNFSVGVMTDKKRNFISLWSILYDIYGSLRKGLAADGKAYEGMMFREVAERAAREGVNIPYEKVVFVGFNVLTSAEEELMKSLKLSGKADFYWDNNAPTLKDPYNKANYFLSDNIRKFPSSYKITEQQITSYPRIEVIGVPSNIGQAKYAGEIIAGLSPEISGAGGGINTAVILPDERLLIPMLYSVPAYVGSINVTMGYPLGETPLAGFFTSVFDLQKRTRRSSSGEVSFYHRNIRTLLGHPYIKKMHGDVAVAFDEDIKNGNKVYVKEDEVPAPLRYIFRSVPDSPGAVSYIKGIIECLQSGDAEPVEEDVAPVSCGISSIEREFLYQYDITLNRLAALSAGEEIAVATFFRLLQKMTAGTKVAFRGEPLSGLQIMGVLETRALDFDNVIILSMNDGVFPADGVEDTFIPYNLRRGFGLSVTEHRDSISAYYFYRLIARAKRVWLIYDTRTEGIRTGEVSRYVYQLKYQYMQQGGAELIEKSLNYKINPGVGGEISVAKGDAVSEKLSMYLAGGEAALSASALNTYIDCPLKFYFNYVERIEEDEDVAEDLDASAFGSIYHGVMQDVYQRLLGQVVTSDIINLLMKDEKVLTGFIEGRFAEIYFRSRDPKRLTGRLFLRGEIIRKMVKRTLEIDKARTPFTMIASEFRVKGVMPAGNGREVNFKGIIDRIDSRDGTVNIIDYKSGRTELFFEDVASLFDGSSKSRNKAVFQLFLYALMYRGNTDARLKPGIYSLRRFYDKQGFGWSVNFSGGEVDDLTGGQKELLDEFSQHLAVCLSDIFDTGRPFVQTENRDTCRYCNFAALCRR